MAFIDFLIPVVLALTMFGVGTSLELSDFKEIAARPKLLGLGLGLQMLFLPAVAFLVCLLLPVSNTWKLGIIILSLCPGGATSNFISYLLELKTALSISLTTINSLLILVTIPVGVNLGAELFMHTSASFSLSVTETSLNVLFIVLLPVSLGVLFHRRFPALSERFKQPVKVVTTLLLATVFAIKFFGSEESGGSQISWADIAVLAPVMLGFHLFTMMMSYWSANRLVKESAYDAITIGIEVGLQNTTLALLVATVMIGDEQMAEPTLVYAMFSFFTTLGFGYLAKRSVDVDAAEVK